MVDKKFLARPGQTLQNHLCGVAEKAKIFAAKIGLSEQGEFIGLLHDFGKYSAEFQKYINSIAGNLKFGIDDDYVDPKSKKGKIDHATAGAQWVFRELKKYGKKNKGKLCGQIFSLCIASHHTGLIDCLKPNGINFFDARMKKPEEKTNLLECEKANSRFLNKLNQLANKSLISTMMSKLSEITGTKQLDDIVTIFYFGFLTRFLFSCLIDADRIDSAFPGRKYECPAVSWKVALNRLEKALDALPTKTSIDDIRKKISDECCSKALDKQGIYTLTVPTGGGKTFASLRYALHHAKKHNLDRIIYIIPYTSIIEQNAEAVRRLIEHDLDENPWVLEHHSNLEPETQAEYSKLVSENWNAPIIFTTMVQFLEVLFGGGTRGVRRLHQLANSVLIFDEIQTLPIKCVHIFCNSLNFLVEHANTTAVLCTATQPLLDDLKAPDKGQLFIPKENKLIENCDKLFEELKRVEIFDKTNKSWSKVEIANLAIAQFRTKNNCLVVVNTKKWAQELYKCCKEEGVPDEALFHLSTNQCSAHRKKILNEIKLRLSKKMPVLCVSTQLIEAGVDIDFAVVIRFLAGLDSIAQAAGRCNRNGLLKDNVGNFIKGQVYIVKPKDEKIDSLLEIKVGQEMTMRVLGENQNVDLLSPEVIKRYFKYYFFDRDYEMSYRLFTKQVGYDTTLLDLLSKNELNSGTQKYFGKIPLLQQSFMTAGKAFKAIDAPTQAVIVPYEEEGKDLIAELCRVTKEFDPMLYRTLLKKAQRYSVNVFPNVWKDLEAEEAVHKIQEEDVFYLDERYYSEVFGLSTDPITPMSNIIY